MKFPIRLHYSETVYVLPDHLAGTNEVDHDLNEENEFPDKVVGTLVEMQSGLLFQGCALSPLADAAHQLDSWYAVTYPRHGLPVPVKTQVVVVSFTRESVCYRASVMFLQAQLIDNELKSEERERCKKIRLAKESGGAVLPHTLPPFFSYSFLPPLSSSAPQKTLPVIIFQRFGKEEILVRANFLPCSMIDGQMTIPLTTAFCLTSMA